MDRVQRSRSHHSKDRRKVSINNCHPSLAIFFSSLILIICYSGNGSATVQAPTALSSVFSTVYTKTIPSYYPYQLQTPNTTSTSTSTPVPTTVTVKGGGGLPTWVGPVLGVVLGLIVIAAAVILFLLWRRRRPSRSAGASETQGSVSGIRGIVLRWLHGTGAQDEKGPVVLGADDMDGVTVVSKNHERHVSEADSVGVQEMESTFNPVPYGQLLTS